jgi:hypothetical protein
MPRFRIHRMKDNARQQFRWAPHTIGLTQIKPKDFEPRGEIEADSWYEAWTALRGGPDALSVGDLLESEGGELRIFKYVGFEEACWVQPEERTAAPAPPPTPPAAAAIVQ